jgi:hypothetical protein
MSIAELKARIINEVNSIEDEPVLREIYNIIRVESESPSIRKLTDAERKSIEAGMKDIAEDRIYASEEAKEMVRKKIAYFRLSYLISKYVVIICAANPSERL